MAKGMGRVLIDARRLARRNPLSVGIVVAYSIAAGFSLGSGDLLGAVHLIAAAFLLSIILRNGREIDRLRKRLKYAEAPMASGEFIGAIAVVVSGPAGVNRRKRSVPVTADDLLKAQTNVSYSLDALRDLGLVTLNDRRVESASFTPAQRSAPLKKGKA